MIEELRLLTKEMIQVLKAIQSSGITSLPVKPSLLRKGSPPSTRSSHGTKTERLEPMLAQALVCQACRLAKTRNQVVFGEGPLDAKLVFVGEGPGREEDLQGRPFVGAAGGLLTKIIEAMGLKREEVYIANVVKCRPPMNRPPQPDEVEACSRYLEAQLSTIQPKVICALGKTAAVALLKLEIPMGRLRGQTFQWKEIPVVVTFHPAYLLRNPSAKPSVWEDMKRVLEFLSL